MKDGITIDNNILKGAYVPLPENPQLGQIIMDIFDKNPNHIAQVRMKIIIIFTVKKLIEIVLKDRCKNKKANDI